MIWWEEILVARDFLTGLPKEFVSVVYSAKEVHHLNFNHNIISKNFSIRFWIGLCVLFTSIAAIIVPIVDFR